MESWEHNDPVARVRILLEQRKWADDAFFEEVEKEANEMATRTREACLALQPAPLADTFRNTLTVETPSLREEREAMERYLESFA